MMSHQSSPWTWFNPIICKNTQETPFQINTSNNMASARLSYHAVNIIFEYSNTQSFDNYRVTHFVFSVYYVTILRVFYAKTFTHYKLIHSCFEYTNDKWTWGTRVPYLKTYILGLPFVRSHATASTYVSVRTGPQISIIKTDRE